MGMYLLTDLELVLARWVSLQIQCLGTALLLSRWYLEGRLKHGAPTWYERKRSQQNASSTFITAQIASNMTELSRQNHLNKSLSLCYTAKWLSACLWGSKPSNHVFKKPYTKENISWGLFNKHLILQKGKYLYHPIIEIGWLTCSYIINLIY